MVQITNCVLQRVFDKDKNDISNGMYLIFLLFSLKILVLAQRKVCKKNECFGSENKGEDFTYEEERR